jgi:hypothetical protein
MDVRETLVKYYLSNIFICVSSGCSNMQNYDRVSYIKDRQKKDNHNMSKYHITVSTITFSILSYSQDAVNIFE